MDQVERIARLRLARSEGVGPITFERLIGHCGSAVEALEALPGLSAKGGRKKPLRAGTADDAEAEIAAVTAIGGVLIVTGDAEYPEALSAIADPPPVLAVLGDAGLLGRPIVAMVGMRNASAAGRKLARGLARDLGAAGLVVSSGMARGIDGAAHEGALATGTVAVLAGGVDVPYPAEHTDLYRKMIEAGAVISEHRPGTVPTARHFPARNRIISGLALGLVVVEAAPRSGSLITARLANEQGRVVFAVPGSPLDPRARGTNDLLRQGAVLAEGADDVVAGIAGMAPGPRKPSSDGLEDPAGQLEDAGDDARALLAAQLSLTPVTVDELVRECQLSAAMVQTIVLELELAGRIMRHPGNRISLVT